VCVHKGAPLPSTAEEALMPATHTATVTLDSGDVVTLPVALIDGDGDESPRFVGMTADGYAVVEAYGITYGLTKCCGASAKGSFVGDEPATVCRSCYHEIDPALGGPVEVADYWTGELA
jgi:hypothetical protein